jgi:hypothetical protein
MPPAKQGNAVSHPARNFNFNKLQAVACMASSAAVSLTLMYWAIKSFA